MADLSSRRPLKSRGIPFFQWLATALARAGARADAISAAGLAFGIGSGVVLAGTAQAGGVVLPAALWLGAAGLVQLRLLANMLDGMVAVEGGRKSRLGPLWNEIPDRVSDSATLVGLGYAAGGLPALGYAAALLALLTAYIRAIGAVNGAGEAFLGWFSKPRRMFFVTLTCLAGAAGFSPEATTPGLCLILAGTAVTCLQRLRWIAGRMSDRAEER